MRVQTFALAADIWDRLGRPDRIPVRCGGDQPRAAWGRVVVAETIGEWVSLQVEIDALPVTPRVGGNVTGIYRLGLTPAGPGTRT